MTRHLETVHPTWAYAAWDAWVPACGGLEVPFTGRTGRRLLYVYCRATGIHAYLDLGTDLILTDEEVRADLAP